MQDQRAAGYIASSRRLLPHSFSPLGFRQGPLTQGAFRKPQVTEGSLPIPAMGAWQPMVPAGVTSDGHILRPSPGLDAQLLDRMHSALLSCWSPLLWAPDPPLVLGTGILASPSLARSTRPRPAWSVYLVLLHDPAGQWFPGAVFLPSPATYVVSSCIGHRLGPLQALEGLATSRRLASPPDSYS